MSGGAPAEASGTARRLRVGMAVYGDITHDSRVQREAEALARAGHEVLLACLPAPRPVAWSRPGVQVVALLPGRSAALPGSRRTTSAGRVLRAVDLVRWTAGYVANVRTWGRRVVDAVRQVDVWHLYDLPAPIAGGRRVQLS